MVFTCTTVVIREMNLANKEREKRIWGRLSFMQKSDRVMEHCKIPNWSFGHPTLRAGPRFPGTKSQGVGCQVSGKKTKKTET
jgi:hypothetical protein